MLRRELKRAIFNKRMALVITIMFILSYFSSYGSLLSSHFFIDREADDLTPENLQYLLEVGGNTYHIWLNGFHYTQIVFVLAAIYPYAASFVGDKRGHFHYFSIIRMGHIKYRLTKLFANGVAGGLALFIPNVLFFLVMSAFFENKILYPFEYQPEGLLGNLFASTPFLYILFVLAIHFALGFSIAIFTMGITSFFSKIVYVYAISFALYLTFDIFISNFTGLEKIALTKIYYVMSSIELQASDVVMINLLLILIGTVAFYLNSKWELKNGS
ncbi:hypothetical protein ACQKNX_04270 [Lysinibacillus sp. NPDC093712]|uniref:hypothetical protein n=1 Tax=Lysinibacillus sp. NPDC093712 TaxID=3390579 RepID=UPI003CFE0998